MKQHIERKQLTDLDDEDLQHNICVALWFDEDKYWHADIGKMIEYLGDSLIQISNGQGNGWAVNHTNCVLAQDSEEELIDALWNAVIIRVKNENENNK